ncbi:hypothetical protein OSB04_un001525 [Centaurea solstitialis]|uniref:DUF4283 domain-containing protein n=1 Tax=Centaurea solstitialis TaxID=347529 RepID=A0AA38S3W6_9ASTR|nr:hypothetical protein OSB04_un001525 [Centaurea solstitialis]
MLSGKNQKNQKIENVKNSVDSGLNWSSEGGKDVDSSPSMDSDCVISSHLSSDLIFGSLSGSQSSDKQFSPILRNSSVNASVLGGSFGDSLKSSRKRILPVKVKKKSVDLKNLSSFSSSGGVNSNFQVLAPIEKESTQKKAKVDPISSSIAELEVRGDISSVVGMSNVNVGSHGVIDASMEVQKENRNVDLGGIGSNFTSDVNGGSDLKAGGRIDVDGKRFQAGLDQHLGPHGVLDQTMEDQKENCNLNVGGMDGNRSQVDFDQGLGSHGNFDQTLVDQKGICNQSVGGIGGVTKTSSIGEYILNPEGYLKNVIQMFDYKQFGGPNVGGQNAKHGSENVFGSGNSDKGSSFGVNLNKDRGGLNCNSQQQQGFVFGQSSKSEDENTISKEDVKSAAPVEDKDGDDLVMKDSVSMQNEKGSADTQDAKPKNAWNSRGPTLADKIKGNTENKVTLKFKEPVVLEDGRRVVRFSKDVIQEGAKLNSMQLVGHFVGASMPFPVVDLVLKRMWKRYGLIDVASNYAGFFILKFNNEEGLCFVLENGPWMINNVPFFVKKWEVGCTLGKPELKSLPLWVNLFGVPLEIWNVKGLGELASGIGIPLTLDRATEERCIKQTGRVGFARVLVEVMAEKSISDYVIGVIPFLDGSGEKEIKVKAEYRWKPPRCDHCKIFGHTFASCEVRTLSDDEKNARLKKESQTKPVVDIDDGFQEVGRRNRPVGVQPNQNGTRAWVDKRFGNQKQGQSLNSGNIGQKEGQGQQAGGLNKGQQGSGGRIWQQKKGINVQQGGVRANVNRFVEVGQSSGVKKDGVDDQTKGNGSVGVVKEQQQQQPKSKGFGSVGVNKEQQQQQRKIKGNGSVGVSKDQQQQQQNNKGVGVVGSVKCGDSDISKQGGGAFGKRVEVKGKEDGNVMHMEASFVQNEVPTKNSFDVLSKEFDKERVEEWFEEGVGVGNDGSMNDLVWQFQKVAVDYYIQQGFNPSSDVLLSWNDRQINYFKAVQNDAMVFEKEDVPEFMKPPGKEKVDRDMEKVDH